MNSQLLKMVRFEEWGSTKLFECCMVILLGCQGQAQGISPDNLAASFCFVASYLALGYFINDLSDQSADKAVGKDRAIHHLTGKGLCIAGIVLVAINIASLMIIRPSFPALFIIGIVLSYIVMLGYSLPPMRFKERGFYGLITAALGQRTLPAIVLIAALQNISSGVFIYMGLLTVNGLRWIVIHQVLDLDNDERVGIKTYASTISTSKLRRFMLFFIFPTEVALGITLTFCFFPTPSFYPLLAYWLAIPLFTLLWIRNFGPINLFSYDYAPCSNFLFIALPMVMLLSFAAANPSGWVLLAFFLVIKWKLIYWQLRNAMTLTYLVLRKGLAAR